MGREGFAFSRVDGLRVDEDGRANRLTKLITQSVRHRVINGDLTRHRLAWWAAFEVRHATSEGSGYGQARRVHVIFHVILRRMSEYNLWIDLTDGGRQAPQ